MPEANSALPIPQKPADQEPHIFGRGMRDRLLMMLAVNDRQLYVTEIAGLLESDPSKVRKALRALTGIGIISS